MYFSIHFVYGNNNNNNKLKKLHDDNISRFVKVDRVALFSRSVRSETTSQCFILYFVHSKLMLERFVEIDQEFH